MDRFRSVRISALVPDEFDGEDGNVIGEEFVRGTAMLGKGMQLVRGEGCYEISCEVDQLLRRVRSIQPLLPGGGSHVRRKCAAQSCAAEMRRCCGAGE